MSRMLFAMQSAARSMSPSSPVSRRAFVCSLAALGAGIACRPLAGATMPDPILTRPIPSSGEALPVVGLGSWITFNVGNDRVARDACAEVMRNFFAAGGRMIDSSPMYGSSQDVIGYGLGEARQAAGRLFRRQGLDLLRRRAARRRSRSRASIWDVPRFDLLQVHNLLSWQEHLPTLFAMKAAGELRYVGITTSEGRRHREIEQIMRSQPLDFVQVTYNAVDREVEARILPLARERGIAVIVNRPFREGALIRSVERHPLPGLGERDRLRQLGAVPAQVHRLASGGHLRDSGDDPRRARAREHGRRPRPPAGRGDAPAHGRPRRAALMSEWWTYSLSDFLLFSPRTYYRLFELYNADIWPAQIVSLALGVVIALVRRPAGQGRFVAAILAGMLALGRMGISRAALRDHQLGGHLFCSRLCNRGAAPDLDRRPHDGYRFRPAVDPVRRAGLCIFLFALVAQPLIGPLSGASGCRPKFSAWRPIPRRLPRSGSCCLLQPGRVAAPGHPPALVRRRAAPSCGRWRRRTHSSCRSLRLWRC